MYLKKLLLTTGISLAVLQAFSQSYSDELLRYSQTTFGGTARTQALAGAQTSLGGDIGSLSANPAGLGLFRRSDFSLSPVFSNSFVKSSYLGNNYSNTKSNLDFESLGAVWATSTPQADEGRRSAGWLSYAFGIGYTRTADFNSNFSFAGKNPTSSFTNFMADQANANGGAGIGFDQSGLAMDNTLAGQAYNGYLLNGVTDPSTKVTTYHAAASPSKANPAIQSGSNYQAGGINDVNLSFGTNYGNVLYLGLGANISTLHYTYGYEYNETGIVDQTNNKVTGLAYSENFDAGGTGFSAKAGFILRPVESFRLGAYVQTPTWYHIAETVNNAQVLGLDGTGTAVYQPQNPSFIDYSTSYNVKTPWKYNFGGSVFIKSYAFLSADLEYVDYRTARFHSGDAPTNNQVNTAAIQNYTGAMNYRLGAEVKLGLIRLRGGYALYGNPYSAVTKLNSEATSISGGIGYRYRNFYIDAALVNTKFNSTYLVYPLAGGGPVSSFSNTRNDFMITFGNRF